MNRLEQIIALATEELSSAPAPATPAPIEWTDEEISMMVSGTPDLHIRNPEQFAKMAPYADPAREPFNSSTWFTTGWSGHDSRPLKAVEVDGVFYRPVPQGVEPDWYAVCKRGVRDVTENPWLVRADFPKNPSRKQMIEAAEAYEGEFRSGLHTWPDDLRAAVEGV
jgi:hypothetical protein